MIPSAANSDYPKFVADQVLTSDNLNDLFGYLDEQGRMTRTNLSGIGIVCGLEVKAAADGSSITISKGVGVTSSGYLVSVPETTYSKRTSAIFDAVKSEFYSLFVNVATKTQKFNLWELKQEAEQEGTVALNKAFLSAGEKIVLIFVELLEENNKNCDPNSCDDKGITVTVNFRPLLIEKANVAALLSGAESKINPWLNLPEISMRRFDVTANPLFECLNFFDAYRKILNDSFLEKTQKSLSQAYNVLQPLLVDDFPTNPFSSLVNNFKFLNDGSISSEQLVAMQYYYDLFSDILLAYNEFRIKGIDFIGMCSPDDIFPRHLLLDLALPDTSIETSNYRHYFIPSPILSDHKKTATHLKILFKKLVLLTKKFAVPSPSLKKINKKVDLNIRITPSVLAGVPFSTKTIPYYYSITGVSDELLKNWNPEKLLHGKSNRNLSYHASKYNTEDEEINQPLLYDLEPYNFLRIEGHIGKPYQHAVKTIADLRDKNRLPFDVIALNADALSINTFIKDLSKLMASGNSEAHATLESIMGTSCNFNDLELLFDSIMTELTGKLSNEMKFFYDLKRDAKRPPLANANSLIPQVPLLKKSDASFRFTNNSIGHEFELFYVNVKNLPFISLPVFFQSFGQEGNNDVMDFVFKAVLYYIEMLYETISTSLSSFTFFDFYNRYYTLIQAVKYIKLLNRFNSEQFPLSEEENDHLDALLSITADSRMAQLYMEFLRRLLQVKIMQQAGFYFISHPGIQHKAGVPLGGTFIMVYHEAEKKEVNLASGLEVETKVFRVDEANEKVEINSNIKDTREITSTKDNLEHMSAGVSEKIIGAREKILTGLKKTINTKKIVVEKESRSDLFVEAADSKADKISSVSAVATVTSAEKSQDVNQRIINYLADFAAYQKNRKADKLDEAIADFDDGIVIADFYLPYLCCSDCPPIQMIVIQQGEPNQPPVARPGDNITVQLPDNIVELDGSTSSDPDGTIKSYLWELQSGPEAKIDSPTEAKTKATNLSEGTYIFKLTVTDNEGATNSATVTITVLPVKNIAPVAVATANPEFVNISANGTGVSQLIGKESKDPDGVIKDFSWSLTSGPTRGAVISNPTSESTLVTFALLGTYVFKLTVTDDKGASDSTSVSVSVTQAENKPPVAVAKAEPPSLTMVAGQQSIAILNGSGSSDPDGSIKSFTWSLSSGPTGGSIINNPSSEKTQVTFIQSGVYMFKLTVSDDKGASNSTTVSISVTQAENKPPAAVATAKPSSLVLVPGQQFTVQLDGSGSSDPEGSIKSFSWKLSSGPTSAVIVNPASSSSIVQFSEPGGYSFTLTVFDDGGKTSTAQTTVNVVQEVVTQKTCALLNNIFADFDKISRADKPEILRLFMARYPAFREINAFFKLMKSSDVVNLPIEAKVEFFIKQKTESQLAKWIEPLQMLIIEFPDFRTFSLLTLNVLTEIAYYISCIQKDDINKADVKMSAALSSVINAIQGVLQVLTGFSDTHRKLLAILQNNSNAERSRLKSNGEESLKSNYVKMIQEILRIFKSMNL